MIIINTEKCIGCGKCVKDCFPRNIEIAGSKARLRRDTCIRCGHCIAVCPENAVSTDEYGMHEVLEYNRVAFSIEPDRLLRFIQFRRTIRQYIKRDVEEEKLLKIIEAGRFTQTGSNAQDVSYIVVKEALPALKEMALETLKRMGEAYLKGEEPRDPTYRRYAGLWIRMYDEFKADPERGDRLFFNAPAVIVVTAVSPIDGGLASSNMELMTDALGLGTMFSGFFVRAAKVNSKIGDFLQVKDEKQIISCMTIGYPDVQYVRTVPRRKADVCWK